MFLCKYASMTRSMRLSLRRSAVITVLSACFVATLAAEVRAGAWIKKGGGYYFKLSGSYLDSETEYDSDGNVVDILSSEPLVTNTSYTEKSLRAYLEYGLSERTTLVGGLPFKVLTSRRTEVTDLVDLIREVEITNAGLGDLALGVRFGLRDAGTVVSVQGDMEIPTGYGSQPTNGGPNLGDGVVNVAGRVLVGASLWPFPGYVTGHGGYRLRGGTLDDEWFFALEAGASASRFLGKFVLDGVYSTSEPPPLDESSTVTVTNKDILKIIAGLSTRVSERFSVDLEIFHVIEGRNTVAGTTYSAGLVFER